MPRGWRGGGVVAIDAGAEVIVMDRAPVTLEGVESISLDLAQQASIEAAVDEVDGVVHAVLSCAGVADGTPGIERINFVGHRHLIARAIATGKLGRGGAIGFISSAAGLGWEANLAELRELLALDDFDESAAWMVAHHKADYMNSKQAMCAYVAPAFELLKQGIRINAICPGPTGDARAGQRGDVAGVRLGLPRRGRGRGVDPARAGLPAAVPVQRRRRGDQRHHPRHRRRLPELGHHRVVPTGHPGRSVRLAS
ncbi:MAG: hypothetical protein R2711_11125 [Acidimicrobiales bacterium]